MEDLMQTILFQNALDMVPKQNVTRIVSGKSKSRIPEKTKGGMVFTVTDLRLPVKQVLQLSAEI